MLEIRECPHCGGEAALCYKYSLKTDSYLVFCKCQLCGAQGRVYSSKECPEDENWESQTCKRALEAWNMRYNEK